MEVIFIPFAATIAPYTLFIVHDDLAESPRETGDNFGTMICFHSRYSLGDEHNFDEPRDFLHKKLFDMYSSYPSSQYCTNLLGTELHFAEPVHILFDDKSNETIYNEVTAEYKE